jgi:preprotein translocase subunit SecG
VSLVTAFNIVQIVICVTLVVLVLLQAKGAGLGSMFGGDSSAIYRTRRGLERRMFQFTVLMAVVFVVVSLASSIVGKTP